MRRKEGRKEGKLGEGGRLALLKFPKKRARRLIPLCTGCLSIRAVSKRRAIFVPLFLSAALLPYFFSWMIRELAEWLETRTTETVSCTPRAHTHTHTYFARFNRPRSCFRGIAMQSWIFRFLLASPSFPSLSFLRSIGRNIKYFSRRM